MLLAADNGRVAALTEDVVALFARNWLLTVGYLALGRLCGSFLLVAIKFDQLLCRLLVFLGCGRAVLV